MKNSKKKLSLIMFIMLWTSCATYHPNIVKDVVDNNLFVEDVKTHQERIVEMKGSYGNMYLLENTRAGDTVDIKSPVYDKTFVLWPSILTVVYFSSDSIDIRARKKELELKKQQLFQEKTR